MQFKPKERPDSQAKLKSDVAHDVRIGGKAKISLGGMSTAVLEVVGIGKDGVSVKDAKGRSYQFHWSHVIAPAGADEKTDDAKAAANPNNGEPMTKALPAKKETPHRALYAGDSVYFSDNTGNAQHGTVAAVGKHGATVDCQDDAGKTTSHNVRHASIIGHRKRAERKLIVIDRGEDGSICADETGKRVFIRGSIGEIQSQKPEQELTKALPGGADILATVNAALASMQQQITQLAGLVAELKESKWTSQHP